MKTVRHQKKQKTQRNGKIFPAHELEKSTILTPPLHPRQQSVQSLPKFQWHLSKK